MRVLSVFFFAATFSVFSHDTHASTRSPQTENERSLLYWRYLCESQVQTESHKTTGSSGGVTNRIELACKDQGWKVVYQGDRVIEVVEDEKN